MPSSAPRPAIPFGRPMLGPEEAAAVAQVLAGPQLVHGPVARDFERAFAARVGVDHAVSLSSCTAGLHLSLLAAGIGAGDEVVVPAMTHVATAHAVEHCGAKPVFADVDPASGNIDPDRLAAAITPGTRAAIVVHYLGLPCDMDRILPIMERSGGIVIEDCALALDARYGDRKAGALGAAGCFSFYPVKHMTCGEGGMLTTNDAVLAQKVAQTKAFGYDRGLGARDRPGLYDVTALGYNFRMSELHAAIGRAQLDKLDGFQAARAANYQMIRDGLVDIEELTIFEPRQGRARSSHYCLNAILPRDGSLPRDDLAAMLEDAGIGTSVHYPGPVPLFSYYREKYGHRPGAFPVAEWLAAQTISLPVGPHLGAGDPRRIADALKEAITALRPSRMATG